MKKTNKKLIGIILIISLFMCIGYAEVSDTILNITGQIEATTQEGVFISNVETTDTLSVVNYYVGTMLDSKTVLGTTSGLTVSYNITLYNNSDKEEVFIGVLTDGSDEYLYSNENIEYTLTGLTEYETVISKNSSLKFTITFKYKEGVSTSNNILESKLNFRFREKPEVALSNENESYTLENIYPGYTSQEYKFKVTNENEESVPMTYSFETTIDAPLKAEIYDGTTLVTGNTTLTNGEKEYTLKIVWDESIKSEEYANKEYSCNVVLKAKPTNTDYAQYEINKGFNVQIKTAAFYFNATTDETNITMENNEANINLILNNYNSKSEYNSFDTNYEISLEDSSKFELSIEDANSGVISIGANENDIIVKITLKDGQTLEEAEKVNLNIKATKPYEKEISKNVTIEVPQDPQEDELAGTWVFNDFVEIPSDMYGWTLDFESYGEAWSEIEFDTINGVGEDYGGYGKAMYWESYEDSPQVFYQISDSHYGWYEDNYRTITITTKLSEMENGEEFLTWLNANASKQGEESIIQFSINGISCTAEKGMTWKEWAISDYNTVSNNIRYGLYDGGIWLYWGEDSTGTYEAIKWQCNSNCNNTISYVSPDSVIDTTYFCENSECSELRVNEIILYTGYGDDGPYSEADGNISDFSIIFGGHSPVWENSTCTICGNTCEHVYIDGVCTICGITCKHNYVDNVCTICGFGCTHNFKNAVCTICGFTCTHNYVNNVCTICGAQQCIAEGTLITLANGDRVPVEELTGEEELLVWNMETGEYDKASIAYIINHNGVSAERKILHAYFSDGTDIEIISDHGFYNLDLNKRAENVPLEAFIEIAKVI